MHTTVAGRSGAKGQIVNQRLTRRIVNLGLTDDYPHLSYTVRLGDLIESVASAHDQPLDQLAQAVAVAENLGGIADSLIGHFVDQARRAWELVVGDRTQHRGQQTGRPETFVGGTRSNAAALDASQGFSRFTPRPRGRGLGAAAGPRCGQRGDRRRSSRARPHRRPEGLAARAIAAQGVSLDELRRTAAATLPDRVENLPALIPFDPRVRTVLARRSTRRLGSAPTASTAAISCAPSWPSRTAPACWPVSASRRRPSTPSSRPRSAGRAQPVARSGRVGGPTGGCRRPPEPCGERSKGPPTGREGAIRSVQLEESGTRCTVPVAWLSASSSP